MSKTGVFLGGAALALSLVWTLPALSQTIDFGDDSGRWINDGQCDDPRFDGPGAAPIRIAGDEGRDASDCSAAFDTGTVTLIDDASPSSATSETPVEAPVEPGSDEIDFGDDSGAYANDDECDDPRFGGTLDSHLMADATDCSTAYEAGEVTFDPAQDISGAVQPGEDIDFGDDSGSYANDGECDDPRFGGSLASHELTDATDCRRAYEADAAIYIGNGETADLDDSGGIDFGADSGSWANDGECDDPRFGGALTSHERADATDCRTAYEADPSIYVEGDEMDHAGDAGDIDFGDDSGAYANDDECDDPRFEGEGLGVALDSHLMADASDCSAAYSEGNVTLREETDSDANDLGFRINFGDDSGDYPNDGECDDPRFQGKGAAMELFESNLLGDASDCRAAFEADTVTYHPIG